MGSSYLTIGHVRRAFGLRGFIEVIPYSGNPDTFLQYKTIYLLSPKGSYEAFQVRAAKVHKKYVLLQLSGIDTRTQAERLKKREIFVHIEDLPSTEKDEYYWYELKGLKVYLENGYYLGELIDFIETGSNDVYICKCKEKEFLIPAIKDVIISIDIERRTMIVRPLPGLWDEI